MFYFGFSDCASAEACLVAFFSMGFYAFIAKKEDLWRFTKARPRYDEISRKWELTRLDRVVRGQTTKYIFAQKVLYSPIYSFWITVPDAEEKIVYHVQNAINNDEIRNQLRNFLDNEATER